MINSHIKLAEIVLVNPSSWSKKNEWKVMRYLDTANITESRINEIAIYKLGEDNIPSRARRIVQSGDFIYSTVRPNQKHYGLLNDIPDNLVVSTGFTVIRSKYPEKFDTRYIYLLVTQNYITDYLHGVAENNTSAYPSLRPSDLTDLKFAFPTISEQKAVSDFIGTLDHKIELNKKLNQTLEDIAKAIFKSWFVDFDPVRAKADGRSTGLPADISDLFPDELVDSEIGEIPKGWEVGSFGEQTTFTKGRSYKSIELAKSKTALVTLKSFLRGGGYRLDGLKAYTGKYKSNQVIKQGDLVIALTDVTQAADVIGKPAIVRSSSKYSTLVASLDVGIVRMQASSSLSKEFCYFSMLTDRYIQHSSGYTSGTTVLHLAKDAIDKFMIGLPPKELTNYFTEVASNLMQRMFVSEKEIEVLTQLRDTLLPKLISGELRVPDAERFIATIDDAPSA